MAPWPIYQPGNVLTPEQRAYIEWANRPNAGSDYPGSAASRNAFTPWSPPPIPSGYYDPNLDATRDSASRGLLNTEQDIGLAGRRAVEDRDFELGGIERDYGRGIEDIGTQRRYGGEDYTRSVNMLTRQYGQLARQQGEQARKYNVTSGGIALMSAAKRNENMGLERADIDTGWRRAQEGFTTAETRLGQDRGTSVNRVTGLYDRGVADRGTALGRARSENQFFGLDTDAQKLYQAQQAGYQAPTGPANEFTKPDGTRYRVVVRNGWRYEYAPDGKVLNKRRAR